MRCFLVEPIWGEPGSSRFPHETRWNPERRQVLAWRRSDTGEQADYPSAFGPGAMWFAYYSNGSWDNESCPHLMVVTPNGGHWDIDSRCSNCTLPNDKQHRCWVRHGDPPNVTVDKAGSTCSAGAGSIITGSYHGFLRNGVFHNA